MDDGRNIKKNMVFLYAWYLKTRNNVNENSNYYILKSATPFPKCYLHKEKWTFDS